MKQIALLGATGSVGKNTIQVVQAYPDDFRIVAFSFYQNIKAGRQLIESLRPRYVAVGTEKDALSLAKEFPKTAFGYGIKGLETAATLTEVDLVLTGLVGSIGLQPTLAAIEAGKEIALANKETLVMGGELVMAAAKQKKINILPVDSEHSAIFQCLQGQNQAEVQRLMITASGGSFRDKTREQLKEVTVEAALQHPNWSMGKKITIDSATMVNKGLEVIEAHWLFDREYSEIEVILHRESVVHSMIELTDGAYLAQLGASDMREPIQYALTYPNRKKIVPAQPFDFTEIGTLHFEKIDFHRFPMLALAYEVGKKGKVYPTIFNAANEVAVAAFLQRKISYLAIEWYIQKAVDEYNLDENSTLEGLLAVDQQTRKKVNQWINEGVYR